MYSPAYKLTSFCNHTNTRQCIAKCFPSLSNEIHEKCLVDSSAPLRSCKLYSLVAIRKQFEIRENQFRKEKYESWHDDFLQK